MSPAAINTPRACSEEKNHDAGEENATEPKISFALAAGAWRCARGGYNKGSGASPIISNCAIVAVVGPAGS